AIQYERNHILDFLLTEVPVQGLAIAAAVDKGDRELLLKLFRHGWSINTPLDRFEPLVLSRIRNDAALAEWLVNLGADPSAGCEINETPLSCAVTYADLSVVFLLLETDPDLKKGYVMHSAVHRQPSSLELIWRLAKKGAPYDNTLWEDPRSFRFRGHLKRGTPLHDACRDRNVEVARVLLDMGAKADRPHRIGTTNVPPTPREIAARGGCRDLELLFEGRSNDWLE
ncbi:Ankyrin repeat-containing domain, partial [Teratosphaeria destructans]